VRSAAPETSAANAAGSPALDSWLNSWHSVHAIASEVFSLARREEEGRRVRGEGLSGSWR
jgi:hypothetical protein